MTGSTAVPFTADDHRARVERAARAAAEAGLAGLLVAPGPDLVWLTGHAPTAPTERLTLEAPDAAKASGASAPTRVEDIVTVTGDGGRRLNDTTRETVVVDEPGTTTARP